MFSIKISISFLFNFFFFLVKKIQFFSKGIENDLNSLECPGNMSLLMNVK